ncbi:hypothetical protein PV08_04077 [Exophiala spinifera]|uniref:Mid2 domain-containing protein n=1 Tax=Exophiala spinifera TaxID=91928 RepID=A0A0D1ZW20_9EURO|nr:uncharacterized protein PV08_04077 [Exophiala spinifera]KIW16887.1 hypothetical protein PV08_04077 [Exophiala spinifera]
MARLLQSSLLLLLTCAGLSLAQDNTTSDTTTSLFTTTTSLSSTTTTSDFTTTTTTTTPFTTTTTTPLTTTTTTTSLLTTTTTPLPTTTTSKSDFPAFPRLESALFRIWFCVAFAFTFASALYNVRFVAATTSYTTTSDTTSSSSSSSSTSSSTLSTSETSTYTSPSSTVVPTTTTTTDSTTTTTPPPSPTTTTTSTTTPITTSSTTTTTTTTSETPSSTTTTESTTSSETPVVITTTSSSISYSTHTETVTSVIPTTSDGVPAFTTLTSVVVATSPATTVVNVGTLTSTPGASPSIAAENSGSGGSSGLSTGAKAGIGAGVGIAVVGAAIFGGWYSWYMRRRRKRNSLDHDNYDANGPIPGMSEYGGSATGGRSGMGAMAAVAGYSSNRSDTRSSELATSPPLQPPPRSPDRLLPAAAAIRSWGSVSPPLPQGSSGMSVSDASEYSQGQTTSHLPQQQQGPMSPAAAAYVNELPEDQRNIHQLPDSQAQGRPEQSHQRHLSGDSGPISAPSGTYSQDDGYYPHPSDGQNPYELPGGQDAGQGNYRGVDPEVPLHQRYDRVPIRPGHLGPSHNF